ncbi:VHS domain-containing protein [Entamoeba marina]
MTDYLVCNAQKFRKQVLDIDFIALLEVIGEFKKQTKNQKSKNIVIDKCMSIVQEWGNKFPNELSDYLVLYQKYVQIGVCFLPNCATPVKQHQKNIPDKAKSLMENIRVKEHDIIQTMQVATDVTELLDLYKRSTDLNSELLEFQLQLTQQTYEKEQIDVFNALVNNYQSTLQLLANSINSNQTNRCSTVMKPIDTHGPLIKVQNEPKYQRDSHNVHSQKKPVERSKFSVRLAQPPTSNGLPIQNPISRTVSMCTDNLPPARTVSTDHFFTTDCVDGEKNEDDTMFNDCETHFAQL